MKFLRLIEAHKHAEILAYIKTGHNLASYEELALIERGNHEEIMTYIARQFFTVESYRSFLKRGNLNEIRFYIANQGVFDIKGIDALEPFIRNLADELVEALLSYRKTRHKYNIPVSDELIEVYECLIIKSGDHCALRRYFEYMREPLQKKSLELFNTKGYATAEDILVYNLTCVY